MNEIEALLDAIGANARMRQWIESVIRLAGVDYALMIARAWAAGVGAHARPDGAGAGPA